MKTLAKTIFQNRRSFSTSNPMLSGANYTPNPAEYSLEYLNYYAGGDPKYASLS
jgi:hypothetical protein